MMSADEAKLIVKVLRDCSERPYMWAEGCEDHCQWIRARYEELKGELGFAIAMERAKVEWLMTR